MVFAGFAGDQSNPFLAVLDLRSGEIERLPVVGTRPQYATTGHIVYGTFDGSLVAIPFDASSIPVKDSAASGKVASSFERPQQFLDDLTSYLGI